MKFYGCKIMGMLFENANLFSLELYFTNLNLNHASFYKLALKNNLVRLFDLQEVDFFEEYLTSSNFDGANLKLEYLKNRI